MKVGDLCITATGRKGRIVEPKWLMPLYYLVEFDDGSMFWILKELVNGAEGDTKTTATRRHSNRKDKQTARAASGKTVLQTSGK